MLYLFMETESAVLHVVWKDFVGVFFLFFCFAHARTLLKTRASPKGLR